MSRRINDKHQIKGQISEWYCLRGEKVNSRMEILWSWGKYFQTLNTKYKIFYSGKNYSGPKHKTKLRSVRCYYTRLKTQMIWSLSSSLSAMHRGLWSVRISFYSDWTKDVFDCNDWRRGDLVTHQDVLLPRPANTPTSEQCQHLTSLIGQFPTNNEDNSDELLSQTDNLEIPADWLDYY